MSPGFTRSRQVSTSRARALPKTHIHLWEMSFVTALGWRHPGLQWAEHTLCPTGPASGSACPRHALRKPGTQSLACVLSSPWLCLVPGLGKATGAREKLSGSGRVGPAGRRPDGSSGPPRRSLPSVHVREWLWQEGRQRLLSAPSPLCLPLAILPHHSSRTSRQPTPTRPRLTQH